MITATEVAPWPGLELVEPLEGGRRNDVWRAVVADHVVAVRRSRRGDASLEWELDLVEQLADRGFVVPVPVRTSGGSRHDRGLVVQRWIDGRAPETADDWRRVGHELQRLHQVTADHPQRPGCRVVTELDRSAGSVDADLGVLPDDVADLVLAVFAECADAPIAVVHGDPNPTNLRILGDGRVGLLDFDESRVDLTWHDLSNLGTRILDDRSHARALRLSHAWEAANAWAVEPDYARRRLALLTATSDHPHPGSGG